MGGIDTSVVYFSSLKNRIDMSFIDSHNMKINSIGGTCNFCDIKKPLTNNINMVRTFREGLRRDVCVRRMLTWQTFDYDENLICNTVCAKTNNNDLIVQSQASKSSISTNNSLRISPNPVV